MLDRLCVVSLLAALLHVDAALGEAPAPTCDATTPALSITNASVKRTFRIYAIGGAIAFTGSLRIDADGAPEAYYPGDSKTHCPKKRDELHGARGLDCLPNAGFPKAPYGVALSNGVPVVQGPDDPAPDYYVSMTSLHLGPADKQRSYVDSSRIPYLAMPGGKAWRGLVDSMGMHLGDVGTVISKSTGTTVNFILADQGNSLEGKNASLAEGSIELANKLGVPSSPRGGGTSSSNFVYVLFPGSGTGKPLSVDEINERADARVAAWGGAAKLKACQANLLPSQ